MIKKIFQPLPRKTSPITERCEVVDKTMFNFEILNLIILTNINKT